MMRASNQAEQVKDEEEDHMLIRTFVDSKLAHNSYLVVCQATSQAIVIDPSRHIEPYLAAAQAEGVRIVAVAETHIHADFVSGSRELAEQTGATLYLSAEGGSDWQYHYATAYPHRLLHDGEHWQMGNLRLQALHTPGHTPEHMAYLLTDGATTDQPIGLFTGDFLFVGDVGRPDLLETAVGVAGAKCFAAHQLYHTLQNFKQLPDYLQIWPAHGAGSACGKSLSAVPSSTLGYERRVNWAFQVADEASFVETVIAGQPIPPHYFGRMKRLNQSGPALLGAACQPASLGVVRLTQLHYAGVTLVDTRPPDEFARGHLPGSINIPFAGRTFVTQAGSFLSYDSPFYLIIDPADVVSAVCDLASIGLDQIAGYFAPALIKEWSRQTEQPLRVVEQMTVSEAADAVCRGDLTVIDVRSPEEFATGHLPHARNIPLECVLARLSEIPSDRPLLIQCKSGFRSSIAAGLLASQGRTNLHNLQGGYQAWDRAHLPIIYGSLPMPSPTPPKLTQLLPLRWPQPAPIEPVRVDNAPRPYWMEMNDLTKQMVSN
jgi:hydroxyacylglutathione hydrolase